MSDAAAAPCDHREGEKELSVRPCVRCGTFVCVRCEASETPHCGPCRRLRNAGIVARERRLTIGIAWSLGAAIVPVTLLAVTGWSPPGLLILGAVLLAGIWGGVSAGGRILTSTLYCIPALATPIGILFALSRIDVGEGAPLKSLIFPIGLGAIPGMLGWFIFSKVLKRLELPPDPKSAS